MQKTAIEKTAIQKITAKITTTALLFFLALFTLTTNLKAHHKTYTKAGILRKALRLFCDKYPLGSPKSLSQ